MGEKPKRNHASGSEWPALRIEGEDIEAIERQYMPSGQETLDTVEASSPSQGVKGSKLARFDLIPEDVMWLLAEHYGRGAQKYAARNWEKGYDWGLSYAALRRHLALFWEGEDFDLDPALYPEGMTDEQIADLPDNEKALHIVAALWHCACLTAFSTRGIGTDTRR